MNVAVLSADWEEGRTDPDTHRQSVTVVLRYGAFEVMRWEEVDGHRFIWGDAGEALEEFIAGKLRKVFELADSTLYVRSAEDQHTIRYSPVAATGQDDEFQF